MLKTMSNIEAFEWQKYVPTIPLQQRKKKVLLRKHTARDVVSPPVSGGGYSWARPGGTPLPPPPLPAAAGLTGYPSPNCRPDWVPPPPPHLHSLVDKLKTLPSPVLRTRAVITIEIPFTSTQRCFYGLGNPMFFGQEKDIINCLENET